MVDNLVGSYCVCNNVQYEHIINVVESNKDILNVEHVQNHVVCCTKCKLCKPDIEKIIQHFRIKNK
jgi:NAD(P)H-nitrite reductase large subunit